MTTHQKQKEIIDTCFKLNIILDYLHSCEAWQGNLKMGDYYHKQAHKVMEFADCFDSFYSPDFDRTKLNDKNARAMLQAYKIRLLELTDFPLGLYRGD